MDINIRKVANETITNNEEWLRKAFKTAPDAMYIAAFATGSFVDVNRSFEDVFGYSAGEIAGKTASDIGLFADPMDERKWRATLVAEGSIRNQKLRGVRKGGAPITILLSEVRLEGLGEDLVFGVAKDITQQTLAEEALKRTTDQLRRSLEGTIEAMAATLESRDPYTAGHQRRVADLAEAIAREMRLPPDIIEGIHFGALIHDLGKIRVPAELLARPTQLIKSELELIKVHPEVGYEIVKAIDFPWPVAKMIRQHHERLDGSGYPQGLKGDEIILEARILAVADVVESMASFRPYRPGLGIEAALAEIEENRGRWYDADVVAACSQLFRQKAYAFSP